MTDCTFFGNCSGGYGGCHNETTTHCVPKDGCTSGYKGLATQTLRPSAGLLAVPATEFFILHRMKDKE